MGMWMTTPTGISGGGSDQEWKVNIVPTGNVDGVNTVFTVPNTYYAGTMIVYVRELRKKNGVDFIENANGFVMIEPPQNGDSLVCDYRK